MWGGAGILGLLIVFVIIMILMLKGPFERDPVTQVRTGVQQIDRSRDAACAANRKTITTNVTQMAVGDMGRTPPPDKIRKMVHQYQCPGGGVYRMDGEYLVFCTEHFPPPANIIQSLMEISAP
jgi:hypothetical protein